MNSVASQTLSSRAMVVGGRRSVQEATAAARANERNVQNAVAAACKRKEAYKREEIDLRVGCPSNACASV